MLKHLKTHLWGFCPNLTSSNEPSLTCLTSSRGDVSDSMSSILQVLRNEPLHTTAHVPASLHFPRIFFSGLFKIFISLIEGTEIMLNGNHESTIYFVPSIDNVLIPWTQSISKYKSKTMCFKDSNHLSPRSYASCWFWPWSVWARVCRWWWLISAK